MDALASLLLLWLALWLVGGCAARWWTQRPRPRRPR